MEEKMNGSAGKSLRLFIAVWPDDAAATELVQLQARIHGRSIPYSNLHLTLAFLGQQHEEVIPRLNDMLQHLPESTFTMTLDRIGYFPRNRVVWAGMHTVPDELLKLRSEIVRYLEENQIGFDAQRDYKPHITLVRDASAPPDFAFTPIHWNARRIVLAQSNASGDGSSYQLLASRMADRPAVVKDESGTAARPG